MENQYIFDSNHDFKKFLNKGFNNVLYSIADIKKANMKKYFNYADRDIFIDIIKTNKELFDNIYYFSIYNFIKQKSISDIVGQQIIKDDNDITKIINNIIDFYQLDYVYMLSQIYLYHHLVSSHMLYFYSKLQSNFYVCITP